MNQNLVVIGTSDREIAGAVRSIEILGGGFAVVLDGKVLSSVQLDAAGCMASRTWESVRDDFIACDEAATRLGCKIKSPFMIMSFVGLIAVPDLGLTELGLVDCKTQGLMDVVLGDDLEAKMVIDAGQRAPVRVCCRCPSHAHDIRKIMDITIA
ncbi:adenine deaminase C-terminal domain-containing protein [Rhexocercosporidium sp. MPI-PUGE-AT-0058]|nr:adenine deaminase C-terminal domain-containing protein [Rhexocercosporidium sp. MPI-PUGE-AT-0058]